MEHIAFFTAHDNPLGRECFEWLRTNYTAGYTWSFHTSLPDDFTPPDYLISFLSGTIIPAPILDAIGSDHAWNVHPGTPTRPGRDCSHWAMYHGDTYVGATLHQMIARVDAGEILAVHEECPKPNWTIEDYQRCSERAAWILLRACISRLLVGTMRPHRKWEWLNKPTTRADFHSICRIPPDITSDELERRKRAFDVPGYDNLVYMPS